MKNNWIKNSVVIVLILLAAFSRLIPHPNNFTAVGALAIFGAYKITNKWFAILIPLVAMWISDLLINNIIYGSYYSSFIFFSPGILWIYLGIVAHSLSGWLFSSRTNATGIIGASLLGAILFFILSNVGVWIGSGMYSPNFEGLTLCFIAAIPFFGNMVAGNLFFSLILFGAYFLVKKKKAVQVA